jgi:hyaluronate lyase
MDDTAVGHMEDAFDAMRLRWAAMLTGGPELDAADPDIAAKLAALAEEAHAYWSSMDRTASRRFIWRRYADCDHSESVNDVYRQLRTMALAAMTSGCPLYGVAELKAAVLDALDWLHEHCYNESRSRTYPNWWHWQIGIPLFLNDITVLLYDDIDRERLQRWMNAVDYFMPGVSMTGANRAWSALIVGVRAVLVKDPMKAAEARDGLSGDGIFPYVTEGDGFYADGSFVQHKSFAYTGGYGNSILRMASDLMALLAGTPWEVSSPDQAHVWSWIYDAYQPLMYKGAMMDMVRGREIARHFSQDHAIGHAVIASVIRLSQIAPAEHAEAFRRLVKAWILEDSFQRFYDHASIEMIGCAKAIVNDPLLAPAEPIELYRQYAGMDRAVLQRPGFALGIAMFSSRIQSYEHMNNTENIRGWYTGAGATYLYNGDLGQYSVDYWPTVDAHRLAGTTVAAGLGIKEEPGIRDWVGGVSLLGRYGACGMDLAYGSYSLTARKSWFLFDDKIVNLGADITSAEGVPIETIVENRKLADPEVQVLIADCAGLNDRLDAAPQCLAGVRWLHLAGLTGGGSDVGYYLPGGANLSVLREARTGSWSEINTRPAVPAQAHTNVYQTIWFDHGPNPAGAAYAYVLLPNATRDETEAYAASPTVEILTNTDCVQSVRESNGERQIVGANFWTDDERSVDLVTVRGQASVMLQERFGEQLDVAVSDPTHRNEGVIEIELARSAVSYTADPGIVVTQLSPAVRFAVHAANARGKTFQASFNLAD